LKHVVGELLITKHTDEKSPQLVAVFDIKCRNDAGIDPLLVGCRQSELSRRQMRHLADRKLL
jgi:hypothetical protein